MRDITCFGINVNILGQYIFYIGPACFSLKAYPQTYSRPGVQQDSPAIKLDADSYLRRAAIYVRGLQEKFGVIIRNGDIK